MKKKKCPGKLKGIEKNRCDKYWNTTFNYSGSIMQCQGTWVQASEEHHAGGSKLRLLLPSPPGVNRTSPEGSLLSCLGRTWRQGHLSESLGLQASAASRDDGVTPASWGCWEKEVGVLVPSSAPGLAGSTCYNTHPPSQVCGPGHLLLPVQFTLSRQQFGKN